MDPPLQNNEIAKKEADKYRAIPQASMMDNPLQFWKERSFDFPNLIVLAEEYLCVQASSVASERVFSTMVTLFPAQGSVLSQTKWMLWFFLKQIWSKNDINLSCNLIMSKLIKQEKGFQI